MNNISSMIYRLLKIPNRLKDIVPWYLISLMMEMGKHTLQRASDISEINISQFSRLLLNHKQLALDNLNRFARRRLKRIGLKKAKLIPGAKWTIAIIVDATLHERSSKHSENVQKFNHGQGWVIGHQWTNIIIYVNNELIPLPSISFLTKNYCKNKKIQYQTEHYKLIEYLNCLDISELISESTADDVVVLMDSGYDNKKLQKTILEKGWSFVVSIKKTRSFSTQGFLFKTVLDVFRGATKHSPWQTIRLKDSKNKRKEFRIRQLFGYLKGITKQIKIVCSEKPNKKERIFIACSNIKISACSISKIYKLRWKIEIFHKEVKSYLGFEDVSTQQFTSVEAHVYWVCCAYLLLSELIVSSNRGIRMKQIQFEKIIKYNEAGKIIQLANRFNGIESVKTYYRQVKEKIKAA